MKIQTIFTGGTIASKIGENGLIAPSKDGGYELLDLYHKTYEAEAVNAVEFLTEEPYRILSENLSASYLMKLFQSINAAIKASDVDGIIVMHGTDTLQYTAAMLQYVFGDCELPILLVSSNYVLSDPRANGLINFAAAVDFIRGKFGTGVFVSYKNPGEDEYPTVHRGTRLQNVESYSSRVTSILDSWYGRFEDGNFVKNPAYRIAETNSHSLFPRNKEKVALDEFSDSILRIIPCPGMKYPDIDILGRLNPIRAVLLGSYHSGTLCVDHNLKAFAAQAKEDRIPVYLIGLTDGETPYETVAAYQELGIIPLVNTSWIAQYCKLWLAADNNKEIISAMGVSIGEDWV